MKYISLILLIISSILVCNASVLESADSAYQAGNYSVAAELYEQVAKEYGTSSELLSNLANSYVKAGDYGHAMLNYKRALQINPSNKVAKQNVKYLMSKVADNNRAELKNKKLSVDAEESSFLGSIKHAFTQGVSSNTWAVWAVVMFLITLGCVAIYIFSEAVIVRKIGFFAGLVLAVVSILLIILSFCAKSAVDAKDQGVITAYKVALYVDANTDSKASQNLLTRGTVMQVLDTKLGSNGTDRWYKVRLNSDFIGWIQASDFEII